jgi:hypothetical protein
MSNTYFNLANGPLTQDWSTTGLIAADDNWSAVPSIEGYRGDGLAGATGVNPATITGTSTVLDVNANRSDPNTFTTGGVTEFDGIANPTVALQGSGTARAPYLVLYLDATGRQNTPSNSMRATSMARPTIRYSRSPSSIASEIPEPGSTSRREPRLPFPMRPPDRRRPRL